MQISNNENALYEVFGKNLTAPERIYYPSHNTTDLTDRFESLKNPNRVVVLVDGSFDVPHPSHDWYLRHCKLIGAAVALERAGEEITTHNIQRELTGGNVALAVTLDADHKISAKKGKDSSKGGVERPIYPWRARADRLASLSYQIGNLVQNTVDLVTVEGDPAHKGTPLEDSLKLAKFLSQAKLLDGLVVYGEHGATVKQAEQLGLAPYVIPDSIAYETNPHTGGRWSSSDIIRRAQGNAPLNPKDKEHHSLPLFDLAALVVRPQRA